MDLVRYFHTLRYLRPVQVYGRVRFKLFRPRPDTSPAPPLRELEAAYAPPISREQSLIAPHRFRFLNVDGDCAQESDWRAEGRSALWAYNLHYFDDLNAVGAATRRPWHQELVRRWIAENPPGAAVAWDPYPTSRRVVNWVKWALDGATLTETARLSLATQARCLSRRIEWHLQGNHLIANAIALIYGGLFFSGDEADSWLRQGEALLRAQIAEQVLADGGHFELSTMYHAGFVEDLLDAANIMRAYGRSVDAAWPALLSRSLVWLAAMSHPDGDIAFFNDAAFGVAPSLAALRDYAGRLTLPVATAGRPALCRLDASGYLSIDLAPFYLVCDAAPVGPDHLPAHAHADTLSFELSFRGRRVFVNSGTSEYGSGVERQRQRGTPAHNTVSIDGQNSSEVWAGFRVARRARARLLGVREEGLKFIVEAEHDGYRRLTGRNTHRRIWTLSAQELCIEDTVDGTCRSAAAFFSSAP